MCYTFIITGLITESTPGLLTNGMQSHLHMPLLASIFLDVLSSHMETYDDLIALQTLQQLCAVLNSTFYS